MMIRKLTAAAILTATALTFGATAAHADTIAITGGWVSTYLGDLGGFSFTGPDFSAGGDTSATLPTSFVPGAMVTIVGTASLSNYLGGSFEVSGTRVGTPQAIRGTLNYTAAPFVVPQPTAVGTGGFSTPFTASGHLTGYSDRAGTTPVLNVDLTGQGTMFIGPFRVVDINGTPTYINPGPGTGSLNFEAASSPTPSPTPEPASLLLLGTGFVAVVIRKNQKRR